MINIGKQLRQIRRANDLSQQAVARMIGAKWYKTIGRIERGQTGDFETIRKIADALGCDIEVTIKPRAEQEVI